MSFLSPLILLALLTGCRREAQDLLINEVMAANDSLVRDPASPTCPEFDDWVELVNPTEQALSLEGVTLEDAGGGRFTASGELGPGEHLLIWADGQPEQGPLHASFKVSASGETLVLSREGEAIDTVVVPEIPRDRSWGRIRDGAETFAEFLTPTPGLPNQRVLPDDPCLAAPDGFDDHSYPCIGTEEGVVALAGDRTDLRIVKFSILHFQDPSARRIHFVDSAFYTLHDQYYLFRLMNGQTFEGLDRYPPYDGYFATWGALDSWARTIDLVAEGLDPNQIRFAGERLYSPYFYATINGEQRDVGVGTVVYRPAADGREAFWGFELEYADSIAYGDLAVYFEMLQANGPPEFASIHWLVRSPEQEAVAVQMETSQLRFHDRITRYSELTVPGEVAVYNPGLTAGLVRRIRAGEPGLEASQPTDILVLDEIPDYLPPCAALITSVPQTPLSHIALLARSRGIPNLYVAGITSDPGWDAWSRVQTRVVLEASEGSFRAGVIPFPDYVQWRNLLQPPAPVLEQVDWWTLPYSYDLATAPDAATLRPWVGGKAAGMRQLMLEPTIDTPDLPMALSIRSYHEHRQQFGWLPEVLDDPDFDRVGVADRVLVLEGLDAYLDRYPTPADQLAANQWLDRHGPDEVIGHLARNGGVVGAFANVPLTPELQQAIQTAVNTQFASLSPGQGLRFRSSSTVEDVEGFNGAGLYISATGFRTPEAGQPSLEDAVREVWASYWGSEAFEERRSAGIDHLAGGMGVLVHPRFDDDYELSNAVITVSKGPGGAYEMLVNAQEGAISVANPPTTCPPVLPESLRVTSAGVERLSPSTEVPSGVQVLDDAQVLELYAGSIAVLNRWLEAENEQLPLPQQRSVLTLDIEAREMAAGWPEGSGSGPRLVIKQSRSLEPSVGHLPAEVIALPAPRDVLARAEAVSRLTCSDARLSVTVHSLLTDPYAVPDLGYAELPLVVDLTLTALTDLPSLGWVAGEEHAWTHLEASGEVGSGFDITVPGGSIRFDGAGAYAVVLDGQATAGVGSCVGETLWASPDGFLLDFL